jgi:hypothetical protein
MSLCQQLLVDYASRNKCPPVLFAAFCEARYDIHKFYIKHPVLLGQHAIYVYFNDIHTQNIDVIVDTIGQLLAIVSVSSSAVGLKEWLQLAQTPIHKEWLELCRDYTLYINLHVQIRPHWHSIYQISLDILQLYRRTTFTQRTIIRQRRRDYIVAYIPETEWLQMFAPP